MIASIPYVKERFDYFNALCFGSKLPPVPLKLSRARTFLGKCEFKKRRKPFSAKVQHSDFVLRISTSFDLPPAELDDIIIHEMIHYYIAYFGIRDSSAHGPVFRSYMNDINSRFGRHITVSRRVRPVDGAGGRRSPELRRHFVCVSRFPDGDRGVTVCASTRLAYINRMLPRCYNIVEKTWYISDAEIFGRYPRSLKARIYKISQQDLDKALESAIPL